MKVTYEKIIKKQVEISQTLIDLFKETFTGILWKDKYTFTLSNMQGLYAILHTIKSDHYINEDKQSLINQLCSLTVQLHNYKSVELIIDKSTYKENSVNSK